MSLDGEELGKAIIAEIGKNKEANGVISPDNAMKAMGDGIGKYIQKNTTIEYSWKGSSASGPDPTQSFAAKIVTISITLTPSMEQKRERALKVLASQIQSGILAASIVPDDKTFQIPPSQFLLSPPSLDLDPQGEQAMTNLGNSIVSWVKTLVNPTPMSGVHGAFGGTAIMKFIE